MALITPEPEQEFEYIPICERKNTTDPLIVTITFMSSKAYLSYMSSIIREQQTVNDAEKQAEIARGHVRRKFKEHVKRFENWKNLDGSENKSDAGVFYDINDKYIVNEIFEACMDISHLREGQRKNFPGG